MQAFYNILPSLPDKHRKLQQQPAPALPAYKNPPALIQVNPDLIVDQKKRTAFLKGGDILFPGGAKIPLPGGFDLPTTGPWSMLLDIPEVIHPFHMQ